MEKECFEEGVGALTPSSIREFFGTQDIVFVAEKEGKIVGYVSGKRLEDKKGEVCSLAVLEDYRGHKIGNHLMKHIHDRMRKSNLEIVGLTVSTKWKPTRELYKKRGYKKVKGEKLEEEAEELEHIYEDTGLPREYEVSPKRVKLKEYYPSKEDAYRMEKNLKEKKRKKSKKKKIKVKEDEKKG